MRRGCYFLPICFVLRLLIDDTTDDWLGDETGDVGGSEDGVAQPIVRCVLVLFVVAHPVLQFSLKRSVV